MTPVKVLTIPTLETATIECRSFAANLRFLRQKLGITQRELGAALEVDHSTIVRWERNQCEPDPFRFMVINSWAKELRQQDAS